MICVDALKEVIVCFEKSKGQCEMYNYLQVEILSDYLAMYF